MSQIRTDSSVLLLLRAFSRSWSLPKFVAWGCQEGGFLQWHQGCGMPSPVCTPGACCAHPLSGARQLSLSPSSSYSSIWKYEEGFFVGFFSMLYLERVEAAIMHSVLM